MVVTGGSNSNNDSVSDSDSRMEAVIFTVNNYYNFDLYISYFQWIGLQVGCTLLLLALMQPSAFGIKIVEVHVHRHHYSFRQAN